MSTYRVDQCHWTDILVTVQVATEKHLRPLWVVRQVNFIRDADEPLLARSLLAFGCTTSQNMCDPVVTPVQSTDAPSRHQPGDVTYSGKRSCAANTWCYAAASRASTIMCEGGRHE